MRSSCLVTCAREGWADVDFLRWIIFKALCGEGNWCLVVRGICLAGVVFICVGEKFSQRNYVILLK